MVGCASGSCCSGGSCSTGSCSSGFCGAAGGYYVDPQRAEKEKKGYYEFQPIIKQISSEIKQLEKKISASPKWRKRSLELINAAKEIEEPELKQREIVKINDEKNEFVQKVETRCDSLKKIKEKAESLLLSDIDSKIEFLGNTKLEIKRLSNSDLNEKNLHLQFSILQHNLIHSRDHYGERRFNPVVTSILLGVILSVGIMYVFAE